MVNVGEYTIHGSYVKTGVCGVILKTKMPTQQDLRSRKLQDYHLCSATIIAYANGVCC